MDIDDEMQSKFIADCAAEANCRGSQLQQDDNPNSHAQWEADQVIREAEAGKATMFATPGRQILEFGNCDAAMESVNQ